MYIYMHLCNVHLYTTSGMYIYIAPFKEENKSEALSALSYMTLAIIYSHYIS